MKKLLCISAMMLLIGFAATPMQAQVNFDFGIKASANMSNYRMKDMKGYDSDMKFGASLGGFVNVGLGRYFALQPELLVNYGTYQMKGSTAAGQEKLELEYWGLEIPVYAVGTLPLFNGKAYVGIGPYVGMGLSLKDGSVKMYKNDRMKRFDFGAAAMIGYEFGFGLQVNASYKMGLVDVMDKYADGGKTRPEVLSLGLGYRF